ncbi:MAG: acyl-CoA synthetase FdrA [Firmicutes bacterium]|nr:acyl-CoA synthetase FdrA [Bacillota bacterium]
MVKKVVIRKNSYYDSVALMIINREVKGIKGIKEAVVSMGTDYNKNILKNVGFTDRDIEETTPNDLIIAIEGESKDVLEDAVKKVNELLNKRQASGDGDEYRPSTFDSALKVMPDANMVLISLPGRYAAAEVEKALKADKHVMLFSDNVPLEDEIRLKNLAKERGLLLMGPDCGTAIINNKPLAFANVVNKGKIGIVGASGTGIQEVTTLISKQGEGISQAIGVGGRDLSPMVGGVMMEMGIKALQADPNTDVIVLISKPPAAEVMDKILAVASGGQKPVIVHFLGGDPEKIKKAGLIPGLTLEDTALKACAVARGKKPKDTEPELTEETAALLNKETQKMTSEQKYIRALYSGGTLCDEAMIVLSQEIGEIYSNIPLKPEWKLEDANKSKGNTALDLGDDEFTLGRPHPMIDLSFRCERILKEADNPETAVILLDVVIGFGASKDPAGELAPCIREAKKKAEERGGYLSVIAYVCGTEGDPQNLREQEEKLKQAGVVIMPSNIRAAKFAAEVIKRLG